MYKVTRYNYNVITPEIIKKCIQDVETLYSKNTTKEGIPEQTQDLLFTENSNLGFAWQILKTTFLKSVSMYDENIDVHTHECKAWCFRNKPEEEPTQWHWHTHSFSLYSGVLYLNLPVDKLGSPCYTTEFILENKRSMFVEPIIGSWFIFRSDHPHRNGLWVPNKFLSNRYCIAASLAKKDL